MTAKLWPNIQSGFLTAGALLLLAVTAPLAHAGSPRPACALPWIFFDLGANTLIDTQTHDFKQIDYMPGAHDYLVALRAQGYHLGMLVNVPASGPDSWGATPAAKLATTQAFIQARWTGAIPFDWALFDKGVAFPPTNDERKPAPYLFERAVRRAQRAGCQSVYQGTLPEEIPAATKAGMNGIRLGDGLWDGSYYYPEAKLRAHVFPH